MCLIITVNQILNSLGGAHNMAAVKEGTTGGRRSGSLLLLSAGPSAILGRLIQRFGSGSSPSSCLTLYCNLFPVSSSWRETPPPSVFLTFLPFFPPLKRFWEVSPDLNQGSNDKRCRVLYRFLRGKLIITLTWPDRRWSLRSAQSWRSINDVTDDVKNLVSPTQTSPSLSGDSRTSVSTALITALSSSSGVVSWRWTENSITFNLHHTRGSSTP